MNHDPQLGKLIADGELSRDAVHMAIAPATAAVRLTPGQRVGLAREDDLESVGPSDNPIGIVDPFLEEDVEPGQRFWIFLFPGTITGLRHVWSHPDFTRVAGSIREKLS